MASVTVGDTKGIDVVDADCPFRPCFALGFDKGSFVQGRGYTSYHPGGPRPVCWTRHMNGCPTAGVHLVCGDCRAVPALVMDGEERPEKPAACEKCGSSDLYWLVDVLPAVQPCCDHPDVPETRPDRPRPRQQRCRSCGASLTGKRLEVARGNT